MSKQIQLSDHWIQKLDSIRSKYNNCSYSKAVEYLVREDNNPNQFISHRIQEISVMVTKEYGDAEPVMDKHAQLALSSANLLREITKEQRKHIQYIEEELRTV